MLAWVRACACVCAKARNDDCSKDCATWQSPTSVALTPLPHTHANIVRIEFTQYSKFWQHTCPLFLPVILMGHVITSFTFRTWPQVDALTSTSFHFLTLFSNYPLAQMHASMHKHTRARTHTHTHAHHTLPSTTTFHSSSCAWRGEQKSTHKALSLWDCTLLAPFSPIRGTQPDQHTHKATQINSRYADKGASNLTV